MRKLLAALSVAVFLALPANPGEATGSFRGQSGFHHGHYGGHFHHGQICHRVVIYVPRWTWASWGGHHHWGRHRYVHFVKVVKIICRPPKSW